MTDSEVNRYLVDKAVSPLDMAARYFEQSMQMVDAKIGSMPNSAVCFAACASCLLKSGYKAILEQASVMLAPFQIYTRERI